MTVATDSACSARSIHRQPDHSGRSAPAWRRCLRLAAPALVAVLCIDRALAVDTYDPENQQLTIPTLQLGTTQYSDVVVQVGAIVSGPTSGESPAAGEDSYSPVLNELTIPAVEVGSTQYNNVVVRIAGLVSIGSVAGADSFSGGVLTVPTVQLPGGNLYTGVTATVASIDGVGGGMPSVAVDTYNPSTHQVTIPAISYGGRIYTNVTFTPGAVRGVGGTEGPDTVLYSFGGSTNGSVPAGLIQANDGNLYGDTEFGGSSCEGSVFRVTTDGSQTVLHCFGGGTDGTNPSFPIIQANDGNLYGAASGGGAYGAGAIFKVTTEGTESLLYSFTGCTFGTCGVAGSQDGAYPVDVIQANDGNFYGTTGYGGAYGAGTVFRITPSGSETVLYSFSGCFFGTCGIAGSTDGSFPFQLIQGSDGNLYGTTESGGAYPNAYGGSVFRLTLAGQETTLYSFSGCYDGTCGIPGSTDGASPALGLVQDSVGNLYGALSLGGAYGEGAVFKLTLAGEESVLHSFSGSGGMPGSADGALPVGLILGSDGNLYGTAQYGGAYNEGMLYGLTPAGAETVLHSFSDGNTQAGSADGTYPDDLCLGNDGNLYGTSPAGGASGNGTVFRIDGSALAL